MPSPLPSRSNGYLVNSDNYLDQATLNAVFGDIHERLLDRETLEASFQALIVEGTAAAINAIQAGIQPQLQPVVDGLQTLLQQIALAEDALLELQQGAVSAASVTETGTRVFVTPAQKAEIGQLRADYDELVEGIGGLFENVLTTGAVGVSVQAFDQYTAKLNQVQQWSKPQRSPMVPLVSAAAIVIDADAANDFSLVLSHNAVLGNFANIAGAVGQKGSVYCKQDATGGRTLGFQSTWAVIGGGTAPAAPTAANAEFRIDYHIVAANRTHFSMAKV